MFMILTLLAGCGSATDTQGTGTETGTSSENAKETSEANATEEPEKVASFPVTITDSTGTDVVIEAQPERIVSIIPSATETAFALGLGDKIVGVSDWDNYPEEVNDIEKIGGLEVNTEKVVSLEPDLILANSSNGEAIQALRDLGLTVLVLDANNLEEVFALIETMGRATGTLDQSENVIREMKQSRDDIVEAVSDIPEEDKKKVWVEVSQELYTAGKGTFLDELITLAGGINIAGDTEGWVQLSEEKVIEKQPDVILTTYGYYVPDAVEQIKARSAWQDIPAVRQDRVHNLNSDTVTRPGPRLVQGLEEIARYLYPEKFE
ncbi:MAG: ABC transporter substrate-binding protein [Bacillaceae bacterium]|nr:ABC transporter substrate-binding protein [Bacillaceae bacterium]